MAPTSSSSSSSTTSGTTKKKKKVVAPAAPTPGGPDRFGGRARGTTVDPTTATTPGEALARGVKPATVSTTRRGITEGQPTSQTQVQLPEVAESIRLQEANRAAGKPSYQGLTPEQATAPIDANITANPFHPSNIIALQARERILAGKHGALEGQVGPEQLTQMAGERQAGLEAQQQEGGSFLGFQAEEGKGVLGGDIATPENLLKAAILGLSIGSLAVGGLALAGKGIQLGGTFGLRLIATRGLSSKAVSTAATGLLPSQQIALFKAGRVALNTKNAAATMSLLTKITAGSKYASYVVGALSTVAGLTAWGEWGRSEGLESMSFTYRKAKDAGNDQLANEITEVVEEATDKETIDYIIRVTPFANVLAGTRLKNIGSDFARKQSEYEDKQRKLEGSEEGTQRFLGQKTPTGFI